MGGRNLAVVKPGASVQPIGPVDDTVKAGSEASERDLLVAMRRKAAMEIDAGVPAHALAPLMRQLRELDREVRAIDARAKEDGEHGESAVDDEAFDATTA